jgi:hypothetical protein
MARACGEIATPSGGINILSNFRMLLQDIWKELPITDGIIYPLTPESHL